MLDASGHLQRLGIAPRRDGVDTGTGQAPFRQQRHQPPLRQLRISPTVFMVYWSRRAGQHVVHVEDFGNGVVYSNIFLPDGSAQRLKGTLTPVK